MKQNPENNTSPSMTSGRLKEILELASNGNATINEAVEVSGASLASASRHSNEIKKLLQELLIKVNSMQEQIDFLYSNNSPIYSAIHDDEDNCDYCDSDSEELDDEDEEE